MSKKEQQLLQVTEKAAEEALSLLEEDGLKDTGAGLRAYVQQGGCAGLSYGLRFEEEPEEDDNVFVVNGLRVFIDPASADYIKGSRLDFDGGLQGGGFIFDNPNVVSECGCGESFRT